MENYRNEIVIVFAGYTQSMEKFLSTNEGLRSRIPNTFVFDDYKVDELIDIGLKILASENYIVDEKLYVKLVKNNFEKSNDRSNGRWIRNLIEQLIRKSAVRISMTNSTDLSTITEDDINSIML